METRKQGWNKRKKRSEERKWMQKSTQGRCLEKCPLEMHTQRDREETRKGLDGKGNKGW